MSTDNGYYWDGNDGEDQGGEQLPHDERVRLGPGRWLILTTWPDGYAVVGQVWQLPGGGCVVESG